MNKELTIADLPGVGPSTAEKLMEVGLDTVFSIAISPTSLIEDTVGCSDIVSQKIVSSARDMCGLTFKNGEELYKENPTDKINISDNINEVLNGGIETGCVTEFFGESGIGKTQLCLSLCVSSQKQSNYKNKIIYIDTNNSFRVDRIKQISQENNLDYKKILKNIDVAKIYNTDHQIEMTKQCEALLKSGGYNLLIVDSIITHFRSEFIGRATMSHRQQKLNLHLNHLRKLASCYNIAVVITNQVFQNFNDDGVKATGGQILEYGSSYRILLKKEKNIRTLNIIDSPALPEDYCEFTINNNGIN